MSSSKKDVLLVHHFGKDGMGDSRKRIIGDGPDEVEISTVRSSKPASLTPPTEQWTPRAAAAAEQQRRRAVHRLGLIDSGNEERFDRITRKARDYFDVSSAALSLITDDQQYLKSFVGPLHRVLDRSIAFCNVTIQHEEPLIISDTLSDSRFSANSLVVAAPFIRFYAGVPVRGPGGWFVGSFCILDHASRDFSHEDRQELLALANEAEMELNTHLQL
ncbi:GAF domain-containing protein [Arthrobacter sp. SX1312]|uniref:GAF domain-containing protein n=1 Tax=Arthrobacter sp. SX1312 TaxID=2058896 RepID=UPI0011B077D9|nr:GAF domain-containing protein [Arthrobacter sp. SX1312]